MARRFTHECVEDGEGLNRLPDGVYGVSKTGQVRGPKSTGKHGGAGRRNIGFSPDRLLAELDAKIAEADSEAIKASEEAQELKRTRDDLTRARGAHNQFIDALRDWHRYDLVGAEKHLASLRSEQAAMAGNDALEALRKVADDRKADADDAAERYFGAERAAKTALSLRDEVIDDKVLAERALDMLRGRGVDLPDMDRMEREATNAFDVDQLSRDHLRSGAIVRLADYLRKAQSGAAGQKGVALRNMRDVMIAFNLEYSDVAPIGVSLDNPDAEADYNGYARIRSQQHPVDPDPPGREADRHQGLLGTARLARSPLDKGHHL